MAVGDWVELVRELQFLLGTIAGVLLTVVAQYTLHVRPERQQRARDARLATVARLAGLQQSIVWHVKRVCYSEIRITAHTTYWDQTRGSMKKKHWAERDRWFQEAVKAMTMFAEDWKSLWEEVARAFTLFEATSDVKDPKARLDDFKGPKSVSYERPPEAGSATREEISEWRERADKEVDREVHERLEAPLNQLISSLRRQLN